ncbi:MAG: DUF4491 family protein [Dysgonamonadaceae bacterium]|jgi:hypothetical protein|nr:DUF4491 family protein [Dysgonamonadaceae bacterium]
MQWIEAHNLTGITIGLATFLIIGLFHPLVIKGEYYFGVKCWWVFALGGVLGITGSVVIHNTIGSVLCGVMAFSSFWGIMELFAQRKRVEKGWFPKRESGKKETKGRKITTKETKP